MKLRFYELDFERKELYGEFVINQTKNTKTLLLLSLDSETRKIRSYKIIKEFYNNGDLIDTTTLKKKLTNKQLFEYRYFMFNKFTDLSRSYFGNLPI